MDRLQLTGLVCVMTLLGVSCSAEDKDASAVPAAAGSGAVPSSALGSESGSLGDPNKDASAVDANAGSAAPPSAAGSEQGTLGDPNVRAKLRDLALRASLVAGISSPRTMIAVASPDHQAAEQIISGAIIYDHAPVYVIVMTGGRFTANMAPPGVPAPQGDVLTLTVDAATYRVTDIGIVNAEPDLSKIASGNPVDLSVK